VSCWYRPRVNPLNLEAAVLAVCSCSRGWWSQVISGVVTLGCLSPRPRVHAPVGACAPVCTRAGVRVRSSRRGGGGVWRRVVWRLYVGCWVLGASLFCSVAWSYLIF
jgi:hypothetical protein